MFESTLQYFDPPMCLLGLSWIVQPMVRFLAVFVFECVTLVTKVGSLVELKNHDDDIVQFY